MDEDSTDPNWTRWVTIGIGLGVTGLMAYGCLQKRIPYRPVIGAAAYVWPEGCPKDNYAYKPAVAIISCACADPRYFIVDARERGLSGSGKGRNEFYRVGNDAVQISQNYFGTDAGKCVIYHTQPEFYRPSGDPKEGDGDPPPH